MPLPARAPFLPAVDVDATIHAPTLTPSSGNPSPTQSPGTSHHSGQLEKNWHAACGIVEVDLSTMSTPRVLQQLYSFDTSSRDFPRCLDSFIQEDEKDKYSLSLQKSDPELTRLVDFLDKVCALPSAFRSLTKHIFRLSVSSPPSTTLPEDVYTNYIPSVAIT